MCCEIPNLFNCGRYSCLWIRSYQYKSSIGLVNSLITHLFPGANDAKGEVLDIISIYESDIWSSINISDEDIYKLLKGR